MTHKAWDTNIEIKMYCSKCYVSSSNSATSRTALRSTIFFFNKEIIESKLAGLERTNSISPGWLGIINMFLTRV